MKETIYVNTEPVVDTVDGNIRLDTPGARCACVMPRRTALALGRAIFKAVAALEDAEQAARPPFLPCHGCNRLS